MKDRPSLFRSIRVRLTYWHVVLVFLTILALGAAVSFLAERELRQNVDDRLAMTAVDMTRQFEIRFSTSPPTIFVPTPDAFSFPSLLVQVVETDGTTAFRSENLGNRQIPVDPSVFDSPDVQYSTATIDGKELRILADPLVLQSGQVVGAVVVAEPLIQLTETLSDLRRLFLLAAVVGAVLSALTGWFISGRALKPVDQMTRTARSLAGAAGDIESGARLEVPTTRDELARLAATFNDLLAKLESSVDTQRRFVADASHELRTPLTAVRGNIDLLQRQIDSGVVSEADVEETLSELRRESERMSRLVDELLTLARSESIAGLPLHCERIVVAEPVEDAARTARSLGTGHDIRVQDVTSGSEADIDRDRIQQIVLILVENAIRQSDISEPIDIVIAQKGKNTEVGVADAGPGVEPNQVQRMFDRFSRIDDSRDRSLGGTGLGLAIAKAIVDAHHGTIRVERNQRGGATFTITFPSRGACLETSSSDSLGSDNPA